MTMPVIALRTTATLPQSAIGGQSALTDGSADQQSYSEDLATLLTGMQLTWVQPDSGMQPLPDQAEVTGEELVQSMLPQPLLFDPLLPDADNTVAILLVEPRQPVEQLPIVQGASSALMAQPSTSPVVSSAVMPLPAELNPVISTPGRLPPKELLNNLEAIASAPQKVADMQTTHAVAMMPALTQRLTSQLNPMTSPTQLPQIPELPGMNTVSVQQAATSALPVWQADPMPAQSQHWGQRLVQMLSDKIDLQLGLNVNKALIRLDPPSLGSLELSVQLEGDRLTVHMHSSNAQLREAMGQGLDQLRASLQQKLGADVQIELRMGSDSSSDHSQHKTPQQLAQQAEANFHAEAETSRMAERQLSSQNLVNQLV